MKASNTITYTYGNKKASVQIGDKIVECTVRKGHANRTTKGGDEFWACTYEHPDCKHKYDSFHCLPGKSIEISFDPNRETRVTSTNTGLDINKLPAAVLALLSDDQKAQLQELAKKTLESKEAKLVAEADKIARMLAAIRK